MKDKIMDIHPTLGILTYKDLINDLEIMLSNLELFEDIVNEILHHTDMIDEDIASLFNLSIIDSLKWNIDVLKDLL